jgi:hypothetical protein
VIILITVFFCIFLPELKNVGFSLFFQ